MTLRAQALGRERSLLGKVVNGIRELKDGLSGSGGRRFNAIQFNGWMGEAPARRLHVAYRIAPDDWRGGDAVQPIVVHRQNAR